MLFEFGPCLLWFGILSSVSAAPGSVCSSGIYKALLPLSNYPPAESYCSSHYPLPAVTSTATTTSIYAGVSTATSLAISTVTSTITSTATVSVVSTATSDVTVTASAAAKRSPEPATTTTANAQASIWSSILKLEQSIVKTACSCIETASTITVTSTIKSTQLTTTTAPTTTTTVVPITTATTATVTTVTTTTITSTVAPPAPTCTLPPASGISCPADNGTYFQAEGYAFQAFCSSLMNAYSTSGLTASSPYNFDSCFNLPDDPIFQGPNISAYSFGDCCGGNAAGAAYWCDSASQATCGLEYFCSITDPGDFAGLAAGSDLEMTAVKVSSPGCM